MYSLSESLLILLGNNKTSEADISAFCTETDAPLTLRANLL